MRKLLFFITIILSSLMIAQNSETEVEKLSLLLKMGTNEPLKRDSIISEIIKLGESSSSSVIKEYAPKVIKSLNSLAETEKEASEQGIVYSKNISDLPKEDLKNFKINDDKFKGITFIHHKREGDEFYPYLSVKNGILNMRLVGYYSGKNWIFFDKIILLVNGNTYDISFPDTNRTVGSGYIYERGDIRVNHELLNNLKEISNAEKIEIRFSGKYVNDSKLSKNQIQVLKETIDLYERLKK